MSRPAPPYAVEVGLPAGWGRGGDSRRHPVPHTPSSHCAQLSDPVEAVPPHPSRTGPAGPARDGFRAVSRKGANRGRTPHRPGCPLLRAGSELITDPLACPLLPCDNRSSPRRPRGRQESTPSRPLTAPVFAMVDPGLPRPVVCLTAAQARQDTECGGEACALAKSWCLTACLTPTTARGEHGAANTDLR